MASVTDVLEKVFTLTSNVDSLTKDVERLNGAMKEHHERIVRLEGRDELIAEKAKNAALQAVVQTNQALLKQIGDLESQLKRLATSPD